MRIESWGENFLWVLKSEKRIAHNTFKSYFYDLKVFFHWINSQSIKVDEKELLVNFYNYLKYSKKNFDSSISRKINTLIAFFKYCNAEKGTNFFIPDKANKKISKSYRSFIESEDLAKIRQFLSIEQDKNRARLLCIIEILYSTGLRVSELLKIKVIDLNEIKKNNSLKIIGKGDSPRIVFFNNLSLQAINSYLPYCIKKQELMFPITRQRIFQLLKNLAAILDIRLEEIFPHSFRHRMLTDLVKKGMNLVNVQKIAGHKQIVTTERYTHVEDYLYEEIYKYHPLVQILG